MIWNNELALYVPHYISYFYLFLHTSFRLFERIPTFCWAMYSFRKNFPFLIRGKIKYMKEIQFQFNLVCKRSMSWNSIQFSLNSTRAQSILLFTQICGIFQFLLEFLYSIPIVMHRFLSSFFKYLHSSDIRTW